MKNYLEKLMGGTSLNQEEAGKAVNLLRQPSVPAEQKGAFLSALRMKGESSEELAGFAEAILKDSIPVSTSRKDLIDTCGTGGDGSNTFNISTAVAFVVAAAGLAVAKHGNRSISSRCGSADVLEILGVPIDLPSSEIKRSLDEYGFVFLFAPRFHPAFKDIAPMRRALGVRTIFNILGPLLNPARVKRQIIGVFDRKMLEVVAGALAKLGTEEALVVSSLDGMDEISLSDVTEAVHLKHGVMKKFRIQPEDAGLSRQSKNLLLGGDPRRNADMVEAALRGKIGAPRDVVALNAGAALWIGGKSSSLPEGVRLAATILESGEPFRVLQNLRPAV